MGGNVRVGIISRKTMSNYQYGRQGIARNSNDLQTNKNTLKI